MGLKINRTVRFVIAFWVAVPVSLALAQQTSQTQTESTQQSASPPAAQSEQSPPATQPASPSVAPKVDGSAKTHKSSTKKKRPRHKPATQTESGKTVIRNGGARDQTVELSPGMSKAQQEHNQENTNQLLMTTDANLKSVEGRQLSSSQQSMLDQIRSYLRQAKVASEAGDYTRAHTLAYKAHLLSDELAKK